MGKTKEQSQTYKIHKNLDAALDAIKNGMSVYAAGKKFNIPKTTLLRKKSQQNKAIFCGAPSVLNTEQEQNLSTWIRHCSKMGFSVSKNMLCESVKMLVEELNIPNTFKNGRPGRHWMEGFMKRNSQISERVSQNITKTRANVTETKIREWFQEVWTYLKEQNLENILLEPSRLFNCDETAFFLCPKDNKVLCEKGQRHVYNIGGNNEKENLTVLVNGNADGNLAPPMIIFTYKRLPANISNNVPEDWAVGKSDTGWMNGETFYEYITNVFYPWLQQKNIIFPVILFVDGHSSHLTLPLSQFCQKNHIILIALPSNATHIMQPMDVAVFRSLKSDWKSEVQSWRIKNNGAKIKNENIAPILKTVLSKPQISQNLKSGFKSTGLFPFNVDSIDFQKCFPVASSISTPTCTSTPISNKNKLSNFLQTLESKIGTEKLQLFQESYNHEKWLGSIQDESLFYLWRQERNDNISLQDESFGLSDTTFQNNFDEPLNDSNLSDLLGDQDIIELNVMKDGTIQLPWEPTNNDHFISSPKTIHQCNEPVATLSPCELAENENYISSQISPKHTFNSNPTIPTPFKKVLFWPEAKSENFKKKDKLPSVVTSSLWNSYHERKKEKKLKLIEEKENRKKLRDAKKNKDKKTKYSPVAATNSKTKSKSKYQLQNYVIVVYEGQDFPGIILDINNDKQEAFIKTMSMCGPNWKWPEKDDVLWYPFNDIVEIINEPELINARGIYKI